MDSAFAEFLRGKNSVSMSTKEYDKLQKSGTRIDDSISDTVNASV
jgi:hypothetical protein